MNKNDIIGLLNEFPYEREDYWVITGAAMILYGIKDQTADVDLGCSTKLADRLEQDGYLYQYTGSGNRWFKYGDHIEIFENWLNDSITQIDGYPVITIRGLVAMKQKLGRQKDLKDFELINAFLKRTNQSLQRSEETFGGRVMKKTFIEMKLFQVKPDRLEQFEEKIEEMSANQLKCQGCISLKYFKRFYTIDGIELGEPPRELTRIVKCVKYYSYWEFDTKENYGKAIKIFFDNYNKDMQKLLIAPFDINLGYSV